MTKKDFNQMHSRKVITFIIMLLKIIFIISITILWIILYNELLDYFFPNRAEKKLNFLASIIIYLLMMFPFVISITTLINIITKHYDYRTIKNAYKPKVKFLDVDHYISEIEKRFNEFDYEIERNIDDINNIMISGNNYNSYIIVFYFKEFNKLIQLDDLKLKIKEKYLNNDFNVVSGVILTEQSTIEAQDYLNYTINTIDTNLHFTLIDLYHKTCFFKLPKFLMGERSKKCIPNHTELYHMILGEDYSKLKKMDRIKNISY